MKSNPPSSPQAALRAAALAFDHGRLADAARLYTDLVKRSPGLYLAHAGLAATLQRQQRIADAINTLQTAARRFPKEPDVYLRLGNLLAGVQQWAAAERCYAAACQLQPANALAQHNWGITLQELGRAQDAIAAFERAIAAKPDYATAFYSLGLAYQATGSLEAALVAFDCAIKIDSRQPLYALEHARTRVNLGQFTQALEELTGLASTRPGDPIVHNLRGIALKNLRRTDEAMTAFDRAIELNPELTEARSNRANLYLQTRNFSKALADYDAALALKPDLDWLLGTRLYTAAHAFDWTGHEIQLATVVERVSHNAKVIQPLALQTLIDSPALQQQAARLWTQTLCAPLRPGSVAAHQPTPGKIRIAYVSKDFRLNPVSYLIAEVIELHDRKRFEVIAINYGAASGDAMQARLRAGFDQFLDVEHLSDQAIAELARAAGVDIAVDLSGFTDEARSSIFAWRAAPVQVSYLGYLGTSGTHLYDYLLSDRWLVTGEDRAYYDERIAQLPSYQANDRQRPQPQPALRSTVGLPDDAVVYCCFNNPCKITPDLFVRWMRILGAVSRSVLWLLAEDEQAPENLRRYAEQHGIAGDRIIFAKRTSREGYLGNLAAADLFLDTLPYNAGTTASDALWMGLPVLTQPGRSFAARMAASLLDAAGMPELIVQNTDAYDALAIQLGQQPAELAEIKARLLSQRDECRLFDSSRFTCTLERAYEEMHQLAVAGEPPRDIVVPD